MIYRILSLGAMALAMFVLNAPAVRAEEAKDVKEVTHDGKVVSTTSDTLVMTGKDGKDHSHTFSADTKLTLDGKTCKSEDLKAGMKIRVTTKSDDKTIATRIEAIDKNQDFASR